MRKRYSDVDEFLSDLVGGSLQEGFVLDNEVFCEMAERLNRGDKKLISILCDNGVLALMAAKKGTGLDDLLVLAGACREE